jgi:hypothetical protein
MKILLKVLIFIVLMTGCDPVYIVYIKNETGDMITIDVEYDSRHYNGKIDTLRFTNKSLMNFKPSTIDRLDKKLTVDYIGTNRYSFIIENNQTVLLEPITIGLPIKHVIYKSKQKADTVFWVGNVGLYRKLKKKGIIVKKGLSTTIINLKPIDNE